MCSDKTRAPQALNVPWVSIEIGARHIEKYQITQGVYDHFLALSQDQNPIHISDEEAKQRGFAAKVMHGGILHGFLSHFVGMCFPGRQSLLLKTDLRYANPCFLDDQLLLEAVVSQKTEAAKVLMLNLKFRREPGHSLVATGQCLVRIQK